jgi:hypothetical protein
VVVFVNDWQWGSYYLPYKNEQVFERDIGTFVLFYKAWHSFPPFSFHKPWLTDSIGCPPTFTYHGGVPFFFYFSSFIFIFGMKQYGR